MPPVTSISAPSLDRENPWPGLAPFTEAQSAQFFGRDAEIKILARRVQGDPLTVLFGQSGLGKSSLLQAGVFPRLRSADCCPIYLRLDHAPGAPPLGEQVKQTVLAETARAGQWTKSGVAKPGESLWEFFHHRDNRLVSPGGIALAPVLVFDQFEELFTLGGASGTERQRAVAFMTELAELVENRPPDALVARVEQSTAELDAFDFGATGYRVVITLREDYLPHLESLKTIMPALMDNRMRLSRMNGVQALEAVVKPGAGLVTEEVARAIVEFVAGARGGSAERLAELDVEPPLLSIICRELNERRKALGQTQISADLVTGNRREILIDFYERSVTDLPESMRTFVEDHLLTKSGFRDNLSLESALDFPGVTRPLIDTLVNRRLLRIEDRLGVERVELTHDVLAEVIRTSRDTHHRDAALATAMRAGRRQRFVIAGLAAAVVGLLIGAFFGIRAQRLAMKRASATDVLLASRSLADGKTNEGLAYLVRAARRDPENPLLATRILTTLVGRKFLLPEQPPLKLPAAANQATYTRDGRQLLALTVGGAQLVIIDVASWRIAREIALEPKGTNLAIPARADGVVALALEDGSIRLFDVESGAPRNPALRPKAGKIVGVPSLQFSPDGQWVVAGSFGTAWLWEARTGEERATWAARGNIEFHPDGKFIASQVPTADIYRTAAQIFSVPDLESRGDPLEKDPRPGSWAFLRFAPDGGSALLVTNSGMRVLGWPDLEPKGSWLPVVENPESLRFSPDGKRLISGSQRAAHVADVATGTAIYPRLQHGGWVFGRAASDDGRVLLTNSSDGFVRLWNLQTGSPLAEVTLQQPTPQPASLAPGGGEFALFTAAPSVHRLPVGGREAEPLLLESSYEYARATFLPGRPTRAIRFLADRAAIYDVASGAEISGGFRYPASFRGSSGYIRSYFSQDRNRVVIRAQLGGQQFHAWKLGADGGIASAATLENPPDGAPFFAIHPAGEHVLGAHLWTPNARYVGIWDFNTGRKLTSFATETPMTAQPEFSPDGRYLTFRTADDVIHVRAFPSAEPVCTLKSPGPASLRPGRFLADSKRLATADGNGAVHFWAIPSGALIKSVPAHRLGADIPSRGFSHDGRRFLTRSDDDAVRVWRTDTMDVEGSPLAHANGVWEAVFSPDGRRIVSSVANGTLCVWDTATSQLLWDGKPADRAAHSVEVSDDNRYILLDYGERRGFRVWPMPPDASGAPAPAWLLRLATACAGSRLSDDGQFSHAVEEVADIVALRTELAQLPADAPYIEWARWFLSDRATRSIAPGFTVTPQEQADRIRKLQPAIGDAIAVLRTRETDFFNDRKYEESIATAREWIERAQQLTGAESAQVAEALFRLSRSLFASGSYVESESVARECLAMRERVLGPDSFATHHTRARVGVALLGQKRYAEAEALLLASHAAKTRLSRQATLNAAQKANIALAASWLARLYRETGDREKAQEWERLAAAPASK